MRAAEVEQHTVFAGHRDHQHFDDNGCAFAQVGHGRANLQGRKRASASYSMTSSGRASSVGFFERWASAETGQTAADVKTAIMKFRRRTQPSPDSSE
jgi:hypothetical protein